MPLDAQIIQNARPENEIHYFRTLGSTMTEASRLANRGAPHGTVVLADEQTSGIGRLGRSWSSEAEAGIYCSVLLRLPLAPNSLPIASLLLGLVTSEAIETSTQLSCDLRWPNDVLIKERKVAGILTHLVGRCVVAGIGINVNQTSLPPDLRTPATSLRLESGGEIQSREFIVVELLKTLDVLCSTLSSSGPQAILRAFVAASTYAMDRRVVIEETGAKGVTAGLDENGFLLVERDTGTVERVSAGGVRPDA